jgi:hypothetical protein
LWSEAISPQVSSINTFQKTNVVVGFPTVNNAVYDLQRKSDLLSNGWTTVASNIPGTGGIVLITNSVPNGTPKQFYRVGGAASHGGQSTNIVGTLGGTAGTGIDSIACYDEQAGEGCAHDVFFNKLSITP